MLFDILHLMEYILAMIAKSSAQYQRESRRRLREQGLVKKEVWVLPEHSARLAELEKQLRVPGRVGSTRGVSNMTESTSVWTTNNLFEALKGADLFTSGQASVELIDGVEPALHIVMSEYGDLPVFLTVSGEQIVVESVLWSVAEVLDVNNFNETILRTHKFFPLSTISLDYVGGNGDYYHMFGALSSTSILSNVVFEIEVLASNVIQATEAYGEFIAAPAEAGL